MKALLDACVNPQHLNTTVLSTPDRDYTARDFIEGKNRMLEMLGPGVDLSGQRVVLLLPEIFSYLSTVFAVNELGGTVVPLTMQYRQDDSTALLNTVNPHIIFTVPEHDGVAFGGIFREWQRHSGVQCTIFEYRGGQWVKEETTGAPAPKDDLYRDFIFFTSGSTGVPKGVVLGQKSLEYFLVVLPRMLHLKQTDRLFNIPPVSMALGFIGMMSALHLGFRFCVPGKFDLPQMVQLMKRFECNKLFCTPSILKALYTITQHMEPAVFQNLKECYLAGEMVAKGWADEYTLLKHVKFISLFGLSEAGGIMSTDLRGNMEWDTDPDLECKFLEDNGASELLVKTPTLFKCYYNQPEMTKESMTEDGYFRTGDLAVRGPGNKILLVGRKKDLIKKGGVQVVPGEVELILGQHPDVSRAAVVGVPHPVFGEQVVAFVVPERLVEPSALYEHCIGRIARYKVPDHIEFVESLPLISGKTDKVTLRKMYLDRKNA